MPANRDHNGLSYAQLACRTRWNHQMADLVQLFKKRSLQGPRMVHADTWTIYSVLYV